MKRIFTLAILALVVVLPVFGVVPGVDSAVGTAAAGTCGVDEYDNDTDRYGTSYAVMGQTGPVQGAETYEFSCEDLQDDLSYYQAAVSMSEAYYQWATGYDNALPSVRGRAWQKLEQSTLNSYDNGTSLANAKIAAKDSWSSFFSKKQHNALETWDTTVYAYDTWDNQSTYGLFEIPTIMNFTDTDPNNDYYLDSYSTTYQGLVDKTVTLTNGTNRTVKGVEVYINAHVKTGDTSVYTGSATETTEVITPFTGSLSGNMDQDGHFQLSYETNSINIAPPPGTDYGTRSYVRLNLWGDRMNKLDNEYQAFNSDYETYVEAIYDGMDTGEISYTDALSRISKIEDWLQQSTTDDSFSMTSIALASMGFDGVAVENTSYMTVEMDTREYNMTIQRDGMLLSYGAPADGWSYNTTYHTDNITGTQMFVDTSGEEYSINGSFTILGAWNNDGDPINSSDIENPDKDRIDTYNASDYINITQQLRDDINALEEKLTDDTGTGGTSDSTDGSSIIDAIADVLSSMFGIAVSGVEGIVRVVVYALLAIAAVGIGLQIFLGIVTP